MNTLIIYATKHGATGKCAEMLKEKLTGRVDVVKVTKEGWPELSAYDRVIVGSSIYGGMARKEIKQFCTRNLEVLKTKKLGFYLCCMFRDKLEMNLTANFPAELLNIAVAKECLGSEMRFSDMSFGEKLLTKLVSGTIAKNDPKAPVLDMKKDMSMLSVEAVNSFADRMNAV